MTLQDDIRRLKSYFLSKDGGVMLGDVNPDVTDTLDLGKSSKRWENVYAKNVFADSVTGGGGEGDADTVDGFHATQNPIADTLLALDPQAVFPTTVYPAALLKDGSRALEDSIAVVAGATIDGIDISEHTHTGGAGGTQMAHADLSGLDADDHPQYTQRGQDEIVTGDWMFTHLQDRSAGWQFLPDDKVFQAVPHNMIFTATATEASFGLGAIVSTEHAIFMYDDASPETYIKVGRDNSSLTLHGTDTTYKIWAGHAVAASAPFHVKNTGAILAESGVIGGWDITATTISATGMVIDSVGQSIKAGTAPEYVEISAADATWRLWAGGATAGTAPFRVNKNGQAYMYDAFVTGTLKSENFISGQSGFSLDSSGLAEFDNIIARGKLQAMVFAESTISVASGRLIISDGAVIAVDCADTDNYIIVDSPVFQADDIVRLKPDVSRDEWMSIDSAYIEVTGNYKYFVTRGLNSTEPLYAGPYAFYAGESVARHGSAAQSNVGYPLSAGQAGGEFGEYQAGGSGSSSGGGYLILEGSRDFGPFFGVAARYGPIFDQVSDVVRVGNLNGIGSYTSEEWGAYFGDDNAYMTYDQTSGLQIVFSSVADVDSSISKDGITTERLVFEEAAAPGTPASNLVYAYADTADNKLKVKYDDASVGVLGLWTDDDTFYIPKTITRGLMLGTTTKGDVQALDPIINVYHDQTSYKWGALLEAISGNISSMAVSYGANSYYGGGFVGRHARGTRATPEPPNASDRLAFFFGGGHLTGNTWNDSAGLEIYAQQTWTGSAAASVMLLQATPLNSTSRVTQLSVYGDRTDVETHFDFKEITAPGTPSTGYGSIYVDSGTSLPAFKDDTGDVYELTGGGGADIIEVQVFS